MWNKIKPYLFLGIGAFVLYSFVGGMGGTQSADLGQALDRTEYALNKYQQEVQAKNVKTISDEQYDELEKFISAVYNSEPKFYGGTLGTSFQKDASLVAFADKNANGEKDTGEEKVFTVEIDSENNRLIATDISGNSSHLRFSGTGFLTGMLIGHLLGRQLRSGVRPGAFNNRKTTARSAYKAPSSARPSARSGTRSGGLSGGK